MSTDDSDTPLYNIAAVVQRTGVPATTIRAWERRYAYPKPHRDEGGQRLYSEHDVETIRWLLDQTTQGVAISRAVDMLRNGHAGNRPSRCPDSASRWPLVRGVARRSRAGVAHSRRGARRRHPGRSVRPVLSRGRVSARAPAIAGRGRRPLARRASYLSPRSTTRRRSSAHDCSGSCRHIRRHTAVRHWCSPPVLPTNGTRSAF